MIDRNDALLQPYLTPYKYKEPILCGSGKEGAFDRCAVDIPFVFQHNGHFFMLYTGFDGIGYQSALAASNDLLHWDFYGMVLPRLDTKRWDSSSAAGTWILKEDNLFAAPTLKKVDGKYWMAYHSYPNDGYETGPAEIGLAWTEDEALLDWHRLEQPVFSWRDGEYWERGGLYKACIVERDGLFHLFYNAKTPVRSWIEQTGCATSMDLLHWQRCPENPVLRVSLHGWDTKFLSDPFVVRDGDQWLNFYFAYDMRHAQDGLALSKDLVRWEKVSKPIVSHGAPGEYDETHAHKAALLYHNGRLYHFYCAVRPFRDGDATNVYNEYRTIGVACSHPFE